MSDFVESINNGLKSRLRNPILGGFIFSWIVFNWRPIVYIILSDESVLDRFIYIDKHYVEIGNLFVWPFATSIIIFMGLPYLMAFLDLVTSNGRILRKKRKSIEIVKEIDFEISRVGKMQVLEDVKAKYADRESLNKNIEELKSQLQKKVTQEMQNENFRKKYMEIFTKITSVNSSLSRLANDFLTTKEYAFEGFPEDTREKLYEDLAELSHHLNIKNPDSESKLQGEKFIEENEQFIKVLEENDLIVFSGDSKNKSRHSLSNWSINPLGMKTLIKYQDELAKKFIFLHINNDDELPF